MCIRACTAVGVGLTLLVAGGCGAAPGVHPASAPAVVPWIGSPAPAYTPPPWPPARPYPTSAPPCTARQLQVAGAVGGVGLGNQVLRLVLRNRGGTACLLHGYPTLTGLGTDGRRRPIPIRHAPAGSTYFGKLVAADIAPGGRGFLLLATTDMCATGARFLAGRLDIGLPGGGRVPSGLRLARGCHGWEMSRMGLPERAQQPPLPRPGSADSLQAVRDGPVDLRISSGGPLRYRVTLRNPTGADVRLSPCPTYTEGLYAAAGTVVRSYRLNCSRVRAIPPHGRATYAMRIGFPDRLTRRAGVIKLGWHLNTPNEPGVVLIVLVRVPST